MSVRLSLLALLDQGACYGYQLRTELDWRTGATGPINVGQIYNTLDRLERDKLVRKTGNFYEITAAGRAVVIEWFDSPSPAAELPGKLALAATLPGVDVAAIIRAQRAVMTESPVNTTPTTSAQLGAAIVAAATSCAAASQAQLLDEAERLLSLGIVATPLSADVPKRGRPAKVSV